MALTGMCNRRQLLLLLVAVAGALLAAACGSDGDTAGQQATLTPLSQTPVARGPIAPPTYCSLTLPASPALNLEVNARWKGKDRLIMEGSVDLPGSARLQAWVCQDGQMTVVLQPDGEPELKKGRIKAEWEKKDVDVGPVFDPKARFEVVFAAQDDVGLPYFVERIPVEGNPQ